MSNDTAATLHRARCAPIASQWIALLGTYVLALVGSTGLLADTAVAQEVIPDFYREPGLYPNRDYANQSFAEHIDPFTGALQLHYVDLELPGNGHFDLKVTRSYNSASIDRSPQGGGSSPTAWVAHRAVPSHIRLDGPVAT